MIVILRGRGLLRLVGPLFVYDMARLARRGRTTFLRGAYASVLLVWLCVMAADRFPGLLHQVFQAPTTSIPGWANFARGFGIVLLSLQAAAVLVLTPAYLAGAFAEEKERRTIDLLFTTDLRDRELVLGKLFGRLLHLALVLLAALPIFALTRLWGGIDDNMLFAGFAVSAMTLLSVGSLSILCSVLIRSVLGAVVTSYFLVFLLNLFCLAIPAVSPLLFLQAWDRQVISEWKEWQEVWGLAAGPGAALAPPPSSIGILLQMLLAYVLVHGFIFLACTGSAIRLLRDCCLAPGEVMLRGMLLEGRVIMPWGTEAWPATEERWRPPPSAFRPKPVREPALLWKEMHQGIAAIPGPTLREWFEPSWRPIVAVLLGCSAVSLLLLALAPTVWSPTMATLNGFVRLVTVFLAGTWSLLLAFRAAGCISRERDPRTLDSLLALPLDRAEILRAKWLGSILRYRQLGYALGVAWIMGLAVGALHPLAVLLLVVAVGIHLSFLASLGLWLSLVSGKTLWANMSMALVVLLLFLGPWLGVPFGERYFGATSSGWLHRLLEVPISPGYTWWFSAFSWVAGWDWLSTSPFSSDFAEVVAGGDPYSRRAAVQILVSLPIFAGVAWALWRLSCRRFQRAARRQRVLVETAG